MRKNLNQEHIEGRLYQHELTLKTVQNQASSNFGKEFIAGTLDVATDEEGLNVLSVHFTYVTEVTNSGKKNSTFSTLKKIIEEGKTWITDGKDAAMKVKIDTALGLNDFYAQDDTLVSIKTNEGGFVTIVNELCDETQRNTFKTDMVITNVVKVEADEEKGILADYISVKGAVFNFRNALLPVEFVVKNEAGMKYFESLDVSPAEPIYTNVWGRINSSTFTVVTTEESAFGEASVQKKERKVKEWVITGMKKEAYEFGETNVMTAEDLTKAMQDREVYLADIKKRSDEYRAQKAAGGSSSAAPSIPVANKSGFNF